MPRSVSPDTGTSRPGPSASAAPRSVQTTETTRALLDDEFARAERGVIDVKGNGPTGTAAGMDDKGDMRMRAIAEVALAVETGGDIEQAAQAALMADVEPHEIAELSGLPMRRVLAVLGQPVGRTAQRERHRCAERRPLSPGEVAELFHVYAGRAGILLHKIVSHMGRRQSTPSWAAAHLLGRPWMAASVPDLSVRSPLFVDYRRGGE